MHRSGIEGLWFPNINVTYICLRNCFNHQSIETGTSVWDSINFRNGKGKKRVREISQLPYIIYSVRSN